MGITARSSRRMISAMRADTIPMPNWLALFPSMIEMLAKRTSCSMPWRNSSAGNFRCASASRSGTPARAETRIDLGWPCRRARASRVRTTRGARHSTQRSYHRRAVLAPDRGAPLGPDPRAVRRIRNNKQHASAPLVRCGTDVVSSHWYRARGPMDRCDRWRRRSFIDAGCDLSAAPAVLIIAVSVRTAATAARRSNMFATAFARPRPVSRDDVRADRARRARAHRPIHRAGTDCSTFMNGSCRCSWLSNLGRGRRAKAGRPPGTCAPNAAASVQRGSPFQLPGLPRCRRLRKSGPPPPKLDFSRCFSTGCGVDVQFLAGAIAWHRLPVDSLLISPVDQW